MSGQLEQPQSLLHDFGARLARVEAYLGLNDTTEGEPQQIRAYDEFVDECLPPFLSTCKKLGDHTRHLGKLLEKAFKAQRAFLLLASQCKKPETIRPTDFDSLSQVQSCIEEVGRIRDNCSEFANHQNMVYEATQALGWLCVELTPKPAVDSFVDGLDFWGNKIRVQYKASKSDHIDFVITLKNLLTQLSQYVKVHHLVGVTWNSSGVDASTYMPENTSTKKTAPAVSVFDSVMSTERTSYDTESIKQVVMDKQTSTDNKLEASTPAIAASATVKKPDALPRLRKPASCQEHNGNWQIEYQTSAEPLTVRGINMKQQIYIFGCKGATILLEGKAKNIVLDSCKKTKLIFDNVVSSLDIVNCKSVQVQCKGVVPSVAIDKTDGCLVYISWAGRDVQFVTSKSSEMNVALPRAPDSDEYVETPIPEQFVHKFMDNLSILSDVSPLYSQ